VSQILADQVQSLPQLQQGTRLVISFKGRHFKKIIILMAVRWYLAYSLSYRNIEELMAEHGIDAVHNER